MFFLGGWVVFFVILAIHHSSLVHKSVHLYPRVTVEKWFYSEDSVLFQHVLFTVTTACQVISGQCMMGHMKIIVPFCTTHTHTHTFYKAHGTFSLELFLFSCSLPLLLLRFVVSWKPFWFIHGQPQEHPSWNISPSQALVRVITKH